MKRILYIIFLDIKFMSYLTANKQNEKKNKIFINRVETVPNKNIHDGNVY